MSDWKQLFDNSHPKYFNPNEDAKLQYGTAGFRTKASVLPYVFYRVGLLASLRSKSKAGQSIGLMITASHNPEQDNGIKLIDPSGEMLEQSWEPVATELVQIKNDQVKEYVETKLSNIEEGMPSTVIVGYDTRPSSKPLLEAALDGLRVFGTTVINYNLVTTPMLHFFVYNHNKNKRVYEEKEYFEHYGNAYQSYKKYLSSGNKSYSKNIAFDGANGVGGLKIGNLQTVVKSDLNIEVFNADVTTLGKLNFQCGADFVKTRKTVPSGVPLSSSQSKYLSVDGDADRIIYWYPTSDNNVNLLDGDRIAVLLAMYINELLIKCNLKDSVQMKVIQTAYTNGNCTKFIKDDLGIDVIFTSTGVKYLHHEALKYDVGVYFEANGHGTVLFSEKLKTLLAEQNTESSKQFLNFIDMTNETVGDSFSIMLLIETVLQAKDLALAQWYALYHDLANKLSTATVSNRNLIKTINADTEIVEPVGMQESINKSVAKYKSARSFVRPSGTEDIVRVYVEAETNEDVKALTEEVQQIVKQYL
uniref:Phosphoacetylglucosamine mutase n=1 Tax=Cacopsylla melanoneura TaxID=428564 RepID=A0A8D8MG93_9HEMI